MSKIFVQQQLKNILKDLNNLKILMKNNSYEELVTNEEKLSLAERRLERILNRSIHFFICRDTIYRVSTNKKIRVSTNKS